MKPIFCLLLWLYAHIGNFGLAIICLTLIIRTLLFPIAQKQFKSMAAMRAIQPKMKAIQERHKDDKLTMQQEIMKLYKEEKVNPIAGCLPIFLQIPIFYALYKVLMVSVEMRHKPFVLWIKDLSAPDPLTPVNLFGYLPFTPPHFLALGVLPILLGITMWLQMRLNPQVTDPVQRQVFALMPWVMMFVMAQFRGRAAALLGHQQLPRPSPSRGGSTAATRRCKAASRRDVSEPDAEAELEEAARKLFSGPVAFLKSAPELKFLPDPGVPEIAFAGRSNVGKSSLLNAPDQPQRARPHLEHAGADAGTEHLRGRRCRCGCASSTCPATASPRRRRTWPASGAIWSTIICAAARC